MGVLNGLFGVVNQEGAIVGSTQKWSITYSEASTEYGASSTKQGMVRIAGNKDWSGVYTALGGLPAIKMGDIFQFLGSIDGTNGVESDAAGAIVDDVKIVWDIEGGGKITHEVTFSANGSLTLGAVTDVPDTTLPPVILSSIIAVPLQQSDALAVPSYSAVVAIRTMELTLSSTNQEYNDSSTGGDTKRVKGMFDAQFTYTLYEADPALLFVPGTVKMLKAFIDGSLFWDLQFMRFGEISNLEADQESGALIGPSQVCNFSGFVNIAGTMTEGVIKSPESSPVTWWP